MLQKKISQMRYLREGMAVWKITSCILNGAVLAFPFPRIAEHSSQANIFLAETWKAFCENSPGKETLKTASKIRFHHQMVQPGDFMVTLVTGRSSAHACCFLRTVSSPDLTYELTNKDYWLPRKTSR